VDAAGAERPEENRVVVGREVFALAMQASASPVQFVATSSNTAKMVGPDQAEVSIWNFGTHETTTYIVDIPQEFTARIV
jgi:hypothetical protein